MRSDSQFVFGLDRAAASRPAQGQMQARYLRGLGPLLGRRGANVRRILERHEIDPVGFADPDTPIACAAAAGMLEYCSEALADPLFGVSLAAVQTPDVFGSVAALARAAPTVRKGLQVLVDYLPVLHSPEGGVQVLEGAATVEVRWSCNGELNVIPQANAHGFVLMLKTLRMLAPDHFHPLALRIGFELHADGLQALQERAGRPVDRAGGNAIVLARDVLDRPVPTCDALLFDLLGGYLARVREAAQPTLKAQVEAVVRGALRTGGCSVERCAARLGVSARTLQKQLAAEGMTFAQIVEAERIGLAMQALRSRQDTLDEVALSLGYSDQTCFGRAFKRWTGLTPQAFREREAAAT
jgi:AraC-like DNA-binding protein